MAAQVLRVCHRINRMSSLLYFSISKCCFTRAACLESFVSAYEGVVSDASRGPVRPYTQYINNNIGLNM